MIRNTDREFLLTAGIEPYEPELFMDEIRSRRRDRVIQAVAVLQFVGLIAALFWTAR